MKEVAALAPFPPFYSDPAFYIFIGEVAKLGAPLALLALIQSATDKRFAEQKDASDKRFTDLLSSLKELRTVENVLSDAKFLKAPNYNHGNPTITTT